MSDFSSIQVGVVDEALNALSEIYDALPKDKRPMHAGDYRDVRTLLEAVKACLVNGGPGVRGSGAPGKTPGKKKVETEMPEAVARILELIAALKQDQRVDLFLQIRETYHTACGHEYKNEKDFNTHDETCTVGDEDDEDEDEDEEEAAEESD